MKRKNYSPFAWIRFLWIALFILFFSGCSYWTDFTAYFNLYYNASVKFDEVNEQLKTQKKELFSLTDTKPSGNVNENLNKVIEKLSKILQFYKESAYFDDALLMIGKSFYLQQDYIKALRKFNELVTTFPDGDLALEGKLWMGRTNFRLRKFDEGNKYFDEIKDIAESEGETDILTDIYAEKVSYFISIESYPEAIANAEKLVEVSGDDEKNALVMYELGKLYLKIDQPENASKSFEAVGDYSPDFDTEFQARLEFGKTQRVLGNNEISLEILEDIYSESIFNEFLDQTELQIGITKIALKKYEEAFERLTSVDTVYKQTQSSGLAKYYLGEIMEKYYGNYDSANVYYSRAMAASLPVEMVDQVKRKSTVFSQYKKIKTDLNQFNKQLAYLDDPELFVKDSIAYAVEVARVDSLNKLNEEEKLEEDGIKPETQDANLHQQPTDGNLQQKQPTDINPPQQLGDNNMQPSTVDQNTPPAIGDQNTRQTSERRKSQGESRNRRVTEGTEQAVEILKPTIPEPVKPSISSDSIHSVLAKNEYELGGLFLTELNNTDSAFYYYGGIITRHPKSKYIARTLFALGTCYLTVNQNNKADSLFEIVYNDFKTEKIANAAAGKLNKPLINFDFDPAEEMYVLAENKMKEEKFTEAITGFMEVADKYPKSVFAPKAWLSRGWILENNLKMYDSAAVVYDSITKKFPNSVYANKISAKLSTYKTEQKRLEAVKDSARNADSLAVREKMKKESLKSDSLAMKSGIQTTTVSDSASNRKQEEFIPDVPMPADSLNINQTDTSGIKRTELNNKTKADSTKVKNDILKQPGRQVNTKNNKPGMTDSIKVKKKFNPVDDKIQNKTAVPKDSLKVIKNVAPVDSSAVKNKIIPVDSSAAKNKITPVDSIKVIKPVSVIDTTAINRNAPAVDTTKINSSGPR